MKLIAAILLGALTGVAALVIAGTAIAADTLNWTWTAPTNYDDCSNFDMSVRGAGYHAMFNGVLETDASGNPVLITVGTNTLSKSFPAGQVCLQLRAVDIDGRTGPWSPSINDPAYTDACGNTGPMMACKSVYGAPGEIMNLSVTITLQ